MGRQKGRDEMENRLCFKVKIGVKDLFHFLMEYNYKSVGGAFGLVISFACLGLLAYSFQDNSAQMNAVLLVIGLLFTVIQPLMLLKKAAVQVVKNPVFRDTLEYEIGDNGIMVRQKDVEQEISWDGIFKICENRKQILVYTSRVNACIWPKEQMADKLCQVKSALTENVDAGVCKTLKVKGGEENA